MTTANSYSEPSPSVVELPRPLVNRLLALAQHSPQQEICGLIGYSDAGNYTCYPVRNSAATPEVRFALDPGEQIEAMRHMRDAGESLFALFHSHPSAPAQPSATDLSEAAYPEALYLIVSLDTKGVLDLRGFRLAPDHGFSEVTLLLAQ